MEGEETRKDKAGETKISLSASHVVARPRRVTLPRLHLFYRLRCSINKETPDRRRRRRRSSFPFFTFSSPFSPLFINKIPLFHCYL